MATLYVVLAILQELCTSDFPTMKFSLILLFYYNTTPLFSKTEGMWSSPSNPLQVEGNML